MRTIEVSSTSIDKAKELINAFIERYGVIDDVNRLYKLLSNTSKTFLLVSFANSSKYSTAFSSVPSILTFKKSSFSPLLIAKIL